MMVPATTLSLTGGGPQSRASAGELLNFASGDDFARWERQLAAIGNCANPVRLRGRIDAIDRATGEKATIYDTAASQVVCSGFLAATAARTSAHPAQTSTRAMPARSSVLG